MDTKDYERQVDRIRGLVQTNKPLWYRMDRAGVASYRYFVKFAAGEIENPSVHKLAAIERFLVTEAA